MKIQRDFPDIAEGMFLNHTGVPGQRASVTGWADDAYRPRLLLGPYVLSLAIGTRPPLANAIQVLPPRRCRAPARHSRSSAMHKSPEAAFLCSPAPKAE